jgi:hypothetical protein
VRHLPTVDGQIGHFQTRQYPETDFIGQRRRFDAQR